MKRISKVCPDAEMYKRCRAFKFFSKVTSTSSITSPTSRADMEPGFDIIAPLSKFFSEEELYGMYDKAREDMKNNRIREGFKQHSFFVDSEDHYPTLFTVLRTASVLARAQVFKGTVCVIIALLLQ